MYSFSPNMLKTFHTCSQKFRFMYILGMNVPQNASLFEKGKKVHALANYYLKGSEVAKLEEDLTEDEKIVWQRLKTNEYFQKKFVNSEYNLSCKIGDYHAGGRIDAIVKDDENIYILDYKTGAVPKEPDYQKAVYLLCVNEFYKLNCKNLYFVYIDLKNEKNHITEFDIDKKLQYEQLIKTICENIENSNEETLVNKSENCKYCEYERFCNCMFL